MVIAQQVLAVRANLVVMAPRDVHEVFVDGACMAIGEPAERPEDKRELRAEPGLICLSRGLGRSANGLQPASQEVMSVGGENRAGKPQTPYRSGLSMDKGIEHR